MQIFYRQWGNSFPGTARFPPVRSAASTDAAPGSFGLRPQDDPEQTGHSPLHITYSPIHLTDSSHQSVILKRVAVKNPEQAGSPGTTQFGPPFSSPSEKDLVPPRH